MFVSFVLCAVVQMVGGAGPVEFASSVLLAQSVKSVAIVDMGELVVAFRCSIDYR